MNQAIKDNRKVYKNQVIELDNNKVFFDGKGNSDTRVLKVYKYNGDINRIKDALEIFCTHNNYDTAIVKFIF